MGSYFLVPVFDLRQVDVFSEGVLNKISSGGGNDIKLWPFPEPHVGSIVIVCYKVGYYETKGFKGINLNVLWVGVLKGDSTKDK